MRSSWATSSRHTAPGRALDGPVSLGLVDDVRPVGQRYSCREFHGVDVARELYVQWTQGLVEHHLRTARTSYGPLDSDYCQISPDELATRLAELPRGLARISVGRYRGEFQSENPQGE